MCCVASLCCAMTTVVNTSQHVSAYIPTLNFSSGSDIDADGRLFVIEESDKLSELYIYVYSSRTIQKMYSCYA